MTTKKADNKNTPKKGRAGRKNSAAAEADPPVLPTGRIIGGIVTGAAALFLALALASYSPDDPCFSHYAPLANADNWMGLAGAYLAGFLRDIFGLSAWLTVPWAAYASCRILGIAKKPRITLAAEISGWLLVLVSLTLMFSLASHYIHTGFMFRAGGVLGIWLSNLLTSWTGTAGTLLIAFVMLLAGMILAVPFVITVLSRGAEHLVTKISGKDLKGYEEAEHGKRKERKAPEITELSKNTDKKTDNKSDKSEDEHVPKIIAPPKKSDRDSGKELAASGESEGENGEPGDFTIKPVKGDYTLPPLSLLQDPPPHEASIDRNTYIENARILEQKLLDFSVAGKVVEICPGPVVTMYEFAPAPGVKINKVASLADDLALALKTHSVRIVAPIPGKAVIGIELANTTRQGVWLKEILASDVFQNSMGKLLLALGNDIVGQPVVTDLARMPHLLIAGATGTGKSVGLNAMICSLLYRLGPDRLRLLMVDPKRIELSLYDGIPHLIHPVVSEPKEATRALKWAVMEMERRYHLLEEAHARNLEGYNENAEEKLPYLVVIIDELADLMMVSSKEVEAAIARLAQMARAAGIHLLIATQRPSVDVLTGLIKANFPARLSFKVSSKVDSRTILDVMGAERLLGLGDMLFLPPGSSALERIHGAYVSEAEILKVVEFLKAQGEPDYDPSVTEPVPGDSDDTAASDGDFHDEKYDEAVEIVTSTGLASISGLQRRMRIGYNRAARIIEQMEREGVVTPTDSMGRRQVIARKYEDD